MPSRQNICLHFLCMKQVEPRREFIETNALDEKFRLSWSLNKQGNLKRKELRLCRKNKILGIVPVKIEDELKRLFSITQ